MLYIWRGDPFLLFQDLGSVEAEQRQTDHPLYASDVCTKRNGSLK